MSPKLIIFDFDGVIADSVRIKRDAFGHVFRKESPETVEWIKELDDRFPEKSRFEKFDMMYAERLRQPLPPERKAVHAKEFSDYCFQRIIECPYIPGALEFLEDPAPSGVVLAVASATPEPELKQILETKKIAAYFSYAMGSPRKKPEMLLDMLARESLGPESALFIGDAMSDYRAAFATRIPFIARAGAEEAAKFTGLPGCGGIVPDLVSLRSLMAERASV